MKVLLTGASFHPSYGGPAFSVSRLGRALADQGLEVGLWAPDGSALDSPVIDARNPARCLAGTAEEALARFDGADILHDNGLWRPHNHRLARLAAERGLPRIVSPRGMLEPWALRAKAWKKAFAWRLYQRGDLQRADRLHATADAEAENLRAIGLDTGICVIPNGVDLGPVRSSDQPPPSRTALFLGRIHPKKGLPMLVEAWARVRPEGWRLLIAGPDDVGHRGQVEATVRDASLDEVVSFSDELDAQARTEAFHAAQFLVLPTHSENFGMVVAEALAHGLPVLTTTGAPWSALAEHRCGWWTPPTVDGLAEALREATAQAPGALRAMGDRGRLLAETAFGWEAIGNQFVAVYEDLLSAIPPAGRMRAAG